MRALALIVIGLAVAALPLSAQEPSARSREAQHAIADQITRCTDDQRQFFATGLARPRYLLFCNCYVYSVLDTIDADEGTYRRTHDGEPSPKFIETSRALVAACIQEARARPLE